MLPAHADLAVLHSAYFTHQSCSSAVLQMLHCTCVMQVLVSRLQCCTVLIACTEAAGAELQTFCTVFSSVVQVLVSWLQCCTLLIACIEAAGAGLQTFCTVFSSVMQVLVSRLQRLEVLHIAFWSYRTAGPLSCLLHMLHCICVLQVLVSRLQRLEVLEFSGDIAYCTYQSCSFVV
jgi:hypothetical protein